MKSASAFFLPQLPRLVSMTIVVLGSVLEFPSFAVAQYTLFSDFEAVKPGGTSAFPTTNFPVTMMGIVLNNPADMLDTTANYQPFNNGANAFNLGGQWQILIQAYRDSTVGGNSNDFGGCEVWMGQNYGNLPWIGDSGDSYTNAAWNQQLARLNYPTGSGQPPLQAGDVVTITGYGLEYAGMMNINEQHQIGNHFVITRLETSMALPAPTVTTLSHLMDSGGNFYFDPTRQTGAEHLQGTRVELNGVRLLSGTWAPNNQVVVTDGSLRRMILNIGNNSNLATAPSGVFNVIGIEDQESTDGSNQDGYTLWVTDQGNVSLQANSGRTFNWLSSSESWNVGGNWNVGSRPQDAGDMAILGGSLALAATVTLDGPQKVGGLILANSDTSTTGYTLSPGAGGTLTLDNSGAAVFLTVISGSHTIAAALALSDNLDTNVAVGSSLTLAGGISESSSGCSLTADGGGLLVLSGTNTYRDGTTVNAGTLIIASDAAIPDGTSLTVGPGDVSIFDNSIITANDRATETAIKPVPEPSTLVLLTTAIAGFLLNLSRTKENHG
jgi:autotransporter-associated beta strand protein